VRAADTEDAMVREAPTRTAHPGRNQRLAERLCRKCGCLVGVQPAAAASAVVCPECGSVIGPDLAVVAEGGPERKARLRDRRHHDAMVSWIVSVVLHMAVLTILVLMAWPLADAARAPANERQVGVVLPADAPIELAAPGEMRLDALAGEVHIPQLKDSRQLQPAWDLSETRRAGSEIERIISIDVGSGGELPAAMKGDWTDFAAGGGGTGKGGASFFGLEARGQKFVFVVDRSGSMTGPKLDAAKAELIRSVRALARDAKFYTIFFNHTHMAMPADDLVAATEGSKRRHFTWVSGVTAGGGTNPVSAMKLALSLKPDVIWLLSDGIFHANAVAAIRSANPGARVQVHTLAFCSREGEKLLQQIAQDSRGQYRFITPASIGLDAGRK